MSFPTERYVHTENAFSYRKMHFLQENALSCRKMRFSGGTWQETAGNCRRASGLKNQERSQFSQDKLTLNLHFSQNITLRLIFPARTKRGHSWPRMSWCLYTASSHLLSLDPFQFLVCKLYGLLLFAQEISCCIRMSPRQRRVEGTRKTAKDNSGVLGKCLAKQPRFLQSPWGGLGGNFGKNGHQLQALTFFCLCVFVTLAGPFP